MSWPVTLLIGYVLLGLELGLKESLRIGPTSISPSFIFPLVAFVALFAQASPAYWTALVAGLMVDLTTLHPTVGGAGGGATLVIGPHALGFVLATHLILTVRSIMMRRNPLVLVVLSATGFALSGLVVVALLSVRTIYDASIPFSPLSDLWQRLGSALYTGGVSLILALILFPLMPLFRFQDPHTRRPVAWRT